MLYQQSAKQDIQKEVKVESSKIFEDLSYPEVTIPAKKV